MAAHSLGASSARLSSPNRSGTSWVKRRTRRLAQAFQVNRREALLCARDDWSHFHPAPVISSSVGERHHG